MKSWKIKRLTAEGSEGMLNGAFSELVKQFVERMLGNLELEIDEVKKLDLS